MKTVRYEKQGLAKKRKQAVVLFFLFLSCFIERWRSWGVGFFFASSSLCLHCGFGIPLRENFSTSGFRCQSCRKEKLVQILGVVVGVRAAQAIVGRVGLGSAVKGVE